MRCFSQADSSIGQRHYGEIMEEIRGINPDFCGFISEDDLFLHALEIKLTTCCSLKCRDCTHLIPYSINPHHVSLEQSLRCTEMLLKTAKVGGLILLGGEVFLYPHLTEYLEGLANIIDWSRVGFVRVTTNGTVLPTEAFCRALRKIPNAYVLFSNYGALSFRQEDAVRLLGEHGIRTVVWPQERDWVDLGNWEERGYTEEELRKLFAICDGKIYPQLYEGHLYHCYRAPLLTEEGMIPRASSDYLDLEEIRQEELGQVLSNYLKAIPYLNACRYCNGFHCFSPLIPAAVQLPGKSGKDQNE